MSWQIGQHQCLDRYNLDQVSSEGVWMMTACLHGAKHGSKKKLLILHGWLVRTVLK